MSTQPRLQPTRRTVLRTAAWTAPAVSIAVAAPAFATSPVPTPDATASTSGSTRDDGVLTLKSVLTTKTQQLSSLIATVTVSKDTIGSITVPTGWSRSGLQGSTATFTYDGAAPASTALSFDPVVTLVGNPTSTVTATVAFAWAMTGNASVDIPLDYVATTAAAANNGSTRSDKILNLKSTLTAGAKALSAVTATVTVDTGTIQSIAAPNGWTLVSGTVNKLTRATNVSANAAVSFDPVVTLAGNPASTVTPKVTFGWGTSGGTASVDIPLAYDTPIATAGSTGSARDGRVLTLKSTLTPGPREVSGVRATVSVNTGTIESIAAPAGWTLVQGTTATYAYSGTAAASTALPFNPVVTLTGNPTSPAVVSTVAFTWATSGAASVPITLAYVAPTAVISESSAFKDNDSVQSSVKHVIWNFKLTNGSQTLTKINAKFTLANAGNGQNPVTRFTVVSGATAWTVSSIPELTAKLEGMSLGPNQVLSIKSDMVNDTNSGGTVGVTIYSDTTQVVKASAGF
ncbi:hypothetical protein [Nocardioides sp. P5_C9_2]